MATVSAFSPQRFFQIANGQPVEPESVIDSVHISLPTEGAHVIPASTPPHNRSLWLTGIVGRSEERSRFIKQIQEGRIPLPLTSYASHETATTARLISPRVIHESNCSVAAILGLTDRLASLAEGSHHTSCPLCSRRLPVFPSPDSLARAIASRWDGKTITLSLEARAEEIQSWANELGYSLQPTPSGNLAARIDTFTCSLSPCLMLQDVFRSTLRVPLSWFVINDGECTTQLSWHGRCEQCNHTFLRPNFTHLRELLEKGLIKENEPSLHREVCGTPLRELLQVPLTSLSHAIFTTLLSQLQQNGIETLELGRVSLAQRASHLSPHAIVTLSLLGSESQTLNSHSVTVLDAPLTLFTSRQQAALHTLTASLAKRAPYVWLSDDAASLPSTSKVAAPPGKLLGTLSFQENAADHAEVRTNRCLVIRSSEDTRTKPIALDLFRALEGSPSPLISFLGENLFSEFFIPFFPASDAQTKLVIHELGAMEPLAKLFAASHHAKMQGLAAKTFSIGQIKRERSVCPSCNGSGLLLSDRASSTCEASPCASCWGTRLRSPAKEVTFKGRTLWEILNAPLSASIQLLKSLPKMGEVALLIELLGLAEIPLGMPVTLLSPASRRLIAIARGILEGTANRPSLLVVEEPYAGLSSQHIEGLCQAIRHPRFLDKTAWIFTTHSENLSGLEDIRYTL